MNKIKRKTLTIQEKMKIFTKMDENPQLTQVQIAKEFNISTSTLYSIILKRKELEEAARTVGVKRKRVKSAKFEELEKILFESLHQLRSKNIPINGSVIRKLSLVVANQLKIENFTASNGWIDRFRKRYVINCKIIPGECTSISENIVEGWKNNVLPRILKEYEPKDIYSANEFGLFFNLLPDNSMTHGIEYCNGEKCSKQRITVLLACNMDGSEKLTPLVIGKSKQPRCFKNIRNFPCDYTDQKNAWMTSEQFEFWLRKIDFQMRTKRRQILMIVDNCPAHPKNLEFLTNLRVEFLPPNSTSHTQPLDMGIIKVIKHYYRKMIARRILTEISLNNQQTSLNWKVNILEAMHFIAASWEIVNSESIQKCFKKAGFTMDTDPVEYGEENDYDETRQIMVIDATSDCPEPSFNEVVKRWNDIQNFFNSSVSFDEFVNIDDYTPVYEIHFNDRIIDDYMSNASNKEFSSQNIIESDDFDRTNNESDDEVSLVTRSEVMDSLKTVRRFFSQLKGADESVFSLLNKIENLTLVNENMDLKQITLHGWFK